MNIFYLDRNPKLAAQYHCDRHVVKMILESAQLLCTALRLKAGKPTTIPFPTGELKQVWLMPDETFDFEEVVHSIPTDIPGEFEKVTDYKLILSSGLYVQTHVNHPCSVWVRENFFNFKYTYELMVELEAEWRFRYGHSKRHKSFRALLEAGVYNKAYEVFNPETPWELTPPALAMPDYCKISSDPVECYREYYRKEKVALHKYTKRGVPAWFAEV